MNDVVRQALDLRELLERFASLSAGATRASVTHDTQALAAALDARELLIPRVAALARTLQHREHTLTADERPRFDAIMRPVLRAWNLAADANAQLLSRTQEARSAVGSELDLVRQAADAASAYGAVPAGAGRYDARR
jgi:hypothetical protein